MSQDFAREAMRRALSLSKEEREAKLLADGWTPDQTDPKWWFDPTGDTCNRYTLAAAIRVALYADVEFEHVLEELIGEGKVVVDEATGEALLTGVVPKEFARRLEEYGSGGEF